MKRSISIIGTFLFLALAMQTEVCAQQRFKTTEESVIAYLEYLPEDYQENSDKYPVVFFLHGIGERGANTTDTTLLRQSVQKVTTLGPPSLVKNGTKFPFILISPQLKNNFGNWPSSYVMEVINHVRTYLRIDEKRIYLTGLSLGGGGAWWTAQDYPELFAALAPVCGGRNDLSKACRIAAENLPVWAFHGDKDTVVPMSRSVKMVDAINTCTPTPDPRAKMTIYPGVAHDAWKYAYRNNHSMHNPNVYEWMMSFTNTVNKGNVLPSAKAGSDVRVVSGRVRMDGKGDDTDGAVVSYNWKQVSGPATAILKDSVTRRLLADVVVPGNYVFSLQVTDDDGGTDTDYVRVEVIARNESPVADAGGDQIVLFPADSVSLNGSAHDPDGMIVSWKWTQTGGEECSNVYRDSTSLEVKDLQPGSYTFMLTVTDDLGFEASDEVMITVTSPPVVNAGEDISVPESTKELVLKAQALDNDGNIRRYNWTKLSGPDARLEGVHSSSVTVTGLNEGIYVFEVSVADDAGATGIDRVTVAVSREMLATALTNGLNRKDEPVLSPEKPAAGYMGYGAGNNLFTKFNASDLRDCLVTVFNETGERIFSGSWSAGAFRRVFTSGGLYLYQIVREGQRVDAGKIYIRN